MLLAAAQSQVVVLDPLNRAPFGTRARVLMCGLVRRNWHSIVAMSGLRASSAWPTRCARCCANATRSPLRWRGCRAGSQPVGGRWLLRWRFHLCRDGQTNEVIEQVAFADVGPEGVSRLDLVCSGFLPESAAVDAC